MVCVLGERMKGRNSARVDSKPGLPDYVSTLSKISVSIGLHMRAHDFYFVFK